MHIYIYISIHHTFLNKNVVYYVEFNTSLQTQFLSHSKLSCILLQMTENDSRNKILISLPGA